MLKILLLSATIGVAAFALSVVGLSAWRLFYEQNYQANHKTSAKDPAEHGSDSPSNVRTEESAEQAIARYNLWLMIFTGVLAVVATIQIGFLISADRTASAAAKAAKDTAKIAKDTLETSQRPFIFITTFEITPLGDIIRVMPKWENSGGMPTQNMRSRVNWKLFPNEPPVDYDYPDIRSDGNPDLSIEHRPAFVGPHATSYAPPLDIPLAMINIVRQGGGQNFHMGMGRIQRYF